MKSFSLICSSPISIGSSWSASIIVKVKKTKIEVWSSSDNGEDPIVIKEFNKDNDLPKVKGILFEGEFMPGDQFSRLADLPSKDELLGKFVGLLSSPMQKLVSTLNAPAQNVLGVLSNLSEKKS